MTLETAAASPPSVVRRSTSTAYEPGPSASQVRAGEGALERGHSGDGVLELQRLLNQAGASPRLVVDGLFGPKTEEAVRSITGRDGETVARVDASAWSRIAIESAKEAPRVDAPSAPKYGEPAPEGSVPARDLVRADEARRSQRRTSGPPEGYRAMTGRIPAGVVAKAKSLLHHDYGTEIPFELEGRRYVARLERHYHPPGYVGGPNGWHKGVTVYEAK